MPDHLELETVNIFIGWLEKQAIRKAQLYDGINSRRNVDEWLRFASEEPGEVASSITRERWFAAQAECVDLAHCAMLVYMAIQRDHIENNE